MNWRRIYWLVAAFTLFQIVIYTLITLRFS